MRTREEIYREILLSREMISGSKSESMRLGIIAEVLLDIRDLLSTNKESK